MGTLPLHYGQDIKAVIFDKDTTVDMGLGFPPFPCLANTPYAFPRSKEIVLGTPNVTVGVMLNPICSSKGNPIQCFAFDAVAVVP